MTQRLLVTSGSPMEPAIGFSRAVRIGDWIAVAGTAPIDDDGSIHAAGNVYEQTKRCIEISKTAIEKSGGSIDGIIRIRVMLKDILTWRDAARAHGEAFAKVIPACTFVEVKGFIDLDWLVELEAD